MRAIKNVGENTVKGILDARAELGRFPSIFQFCDHVDTRLLNKRVLESLIKAGRHGFAGRAPFADVCGHRPRHGSARRSRSANDQWAARPFWRSVSARRSRPTNLCRNRGVAGARNAGLRIRHRGLLYFRASARKISQRKLKELGALDLAAVEGRRNGEEITVAGIVIAMRPMRSRKGGRWGILTLQDMTGVLEVLAFPESFARLENLFKSNAPLILKGRVNVEEAGTRLAVMDGRQLEDMGQRQPGVMRVRVDLQSVDSTLLDELKELF